MDGNYLADCFFTEDELTERDIELLTHKIGTDSTERRVCTYKINSAKGFTGKVVILAADSITDTQESLNRQIAEHGLTTTIGSFSDSTVHWQRLLDAVYVVADRWKYKPKFDGLCMDRVYTNNKVIEGMIG